MTLILDPPVDLAPDVVDDATRREFVAILVASGFIEGGCGSDENGADVAAGPRRVKDVYGSVTVPGDPRRIIVVSDSIVANLFALGFPAQRIAGWTIDDFKPGNYDYVGDRVDELSALEVVGGVHEPDVERVLRLNPDLILVIGEPAGGSNHEFFRELYDRLAATRVPVFAAFNGYASIDDQVRLLTDVGRAIGREQQAAGIERALRRDIAALRERLAERQTPSAMVLRAFEPTVLNSVLQPLLDALEVPGDRPTPEQYGVEVSAERLERFDSDVLFVSYSGSEDAIRGALEANALWDRLPAVRAGRVFFVPNSRWADNFSIPALNAQIRDVESALGADAPNPRSTP